MNEFELIQTFFNQQKPTDWLSVSIGDDGAVLAADDHKQVVVTDTLVEGVHFFAGTSAHAIGHKALAVNLSDLAAMGAAPKWFTLNLTLPALDKAWLAGFSKGLFELARQSGIQLIGGDTTRGPLSVSITAAGVLNQQQQPFLRSGAAAGGTLAVVGALGLAGLAVQSREHGNSHSLEQAQALDYPQPQCEAAQHLHGIAAAACDVSDGLLADLGHIATASHCGFELDGDALADLVPATDEVAARQFFAGGDDYALLFVTKPGVAVPDFAQVLGVATSALGIGLKGGPNWLQAAFSSIQQRTGYQHF